MIRVLIEITGDEKAKKEYRSDVQVEFRSYGDATAFCLGGLIGDAVEGIHRHLVWTDCTKSFLEKLIDGIVESLPEHLTGKTDD